MKKFFGILVVFLVLINGQVSAAEKPDYEKYGKIAIVVVQADYPGDEVTDYEYLGRKTLENGQVEDSFLFLISDKGSEFNVTVKIKHNLSNDKLLNLTVEESKS